MVMERTMVVETDWASNRPRKPNDDMVAYLMSVKGSLDSGVESFERTLLIKNALDSINEAGAEASLSSHKRTSFVVETLLDSLDMANEEDRNLLERFIVCCKGYYGWLTYNRFSSHVMETAFIKVYQCINEANVSDSKNGADIASGKGTKCLMWQIVLELSDKLIESEQWWNMSFDRCATHSIRSLFCVLKGTDPANVLKRKRPRGRNKRLSSMFQNREASEKQSTGYVIPKFIMRLNRFLREASKWSGSDLCKACCDTYASPVLQLLLDFTSTQKPLKSQLNQGIQDSKTWEQLVGRILRTGPCIVGEGIAENEEQRKRSFKLLSCHYVASHVMQMVVSKCSPEYFKEALLERFHGNFHELSVHNVANFVIQDAIVRLNTEDELSIALKELKGGIAKDLLKGNLGVIWRLAQACNLYQSLQKEIVLPLVTGLRQRHSFQQSKGPYPGVVEILLNIHESNDAGIDLDETFLIKDSKESKVSSLGALIIEAVLSFEIGNARVFLESIASLDAAKLNTISKDPIAGPKVFETLMGAPTSHSWARQRIMMKLLPSIASLCESKYAWKGVQLAFSNGTQKEKLSIAKALSKVRSRLAGNTFGSRVLKHCKIDLYHQQPEQWRKFQSKSDIKKKTKLLASFMDEIETIKPSIKQRQKKRRKTRH